MQKKLLIFILLITALNGNELVDALKGKKSQPSKATKATEDRPSKNVCDEKIVEAIEKNNLIFFRDKKGELKNMNNCLVSNDLTPMMMAAYSDRTKIVKLFLSDGVSPDETNMRNYTALHFAVFYGNYEVAEALLEGGANIDAINDAGQTPLMIAAYYGNAKTAKMLISKGADTMIRDRVGFNARELAEKKNKKDVLKILK